MNTLSKSVDVFDLVPIWGEDAPNEHIARFGGHPNAEGCLALAKEFVKRNFF